MKSYLTSAEQSLFDFLEENQEKISYLSITQIAEEANVSTATVTRTIKKLGYRDIHHYRQSLAEGRKEIIHDFSWEASQLIDKNIQEVLRTINLLNSTDIEEAIGLINRSQNIAILAEGPSIFVANGLAGKLQLIGKKPQVHSDKTDMLYYARQATEEKLFFVISQRGESVDIVNAVKMIKQRKAKVIVITGGYNSSLALLGDITINCYNSPRKVIGFGIDVSSRIPLEIVVRILIDLWILEQEKGTIKTEEIQF